MRFHHLRTRIIVFFVALLATVQIVALLFVNNANNSNAQKKTDDEFAVGQRVFEQLLTQNRERLSLAARVLAADFGFREAVASKDVDTIVSALDNSGSRIGANVMSLVSLDKTVIADTLNPQHVAQPYEFGNLLDQAASGGNASSIELINGRAYQIVLVPVLAPVPIAWVSMGFVVDDALAKELRQLTTLEVSFLELGASGKWGLLASTLDDTSKQALQQDLPDLDGALNKRELEIDKEVQRIRVLKLEQHGDTVVVAVLQRSLRESFAAFNTLQSTLLFLGMIGLAVSVLFSAAIAMGITKPLSQLVSAATRIEKGDYAGTVELGRSDEIGVLAHSLDKMRNGIAEREQEILRLAYQDTLTGLPNRSLFNERLQQAIANAHRSGQTLTILMMDLDRFKYVNDTLGHAVGDHVLRAVAERLNQLLRNSDTVARLGGDEFAILLSTGQSDHASRVAHKIVRTLEQPITYEDQPLDVGTSIGIACFPEHGADAGTLLRNADIAMYVAKRNKTGFAIYNPEYDTNQQEHLSLLGELRHAVEHNELKVFYQPKVSLLNSSVGAVEALLRWDHPTRGFISPAQFIPFAEHTGYIKVLTRWVLSESLRQCGVWHAAGLSLRVSVNISARDLMNRDLPEQIAEMMATHNVPPDLLCLEITESGFMEDPTHAQKVLQRLSDLGIQLSIDDYGTGYSSLSYIVQLPVDELKIDRSFVMNMSSDEHTSTIVRSTIELGHSLGLKVVAEGVEDESGLKMLRDLGCDQAQGYFISKPVPAATLEAWLINRQKLADAAQSKAVSGFDELPPVAQAG
ncbi:MAG: EAL domain-containing protein [Steroidobacteraceae bacterium]